MTTKIHNHNPQVDFPIYHNSGTPRPAPNVGPHLNPDQGGSVPVADYSGGGNSPGTGEASPNKA